MPDARPTTPGKNHAMPDPRLRARWFRSRFGAKARPPIFALLCLVLLPLSAAAQAVDPVTEAPMRFGIFGVAPRISVTHVGIDTNVFNEVDDPKRDFTVQLSPAADVWMRAGRGLFSFNGQMDLTWFKEYGTERSVGGTGGVRYDHRFNRLVPFASYDIANTRQRPGYEIDVRARSLTDTARVGAALRVGPKTDVELSYRRQGVDFDGAITFGGRPIDEALNRTLQAVDLSYRQRLTVLTTWVLRASSERERFEFSPDRDADSIRASTGFELGRFALIRGHAFLGLRRLTAANGGTMPEYSGVTMDVGVTYSAPTRTRVQMVTRRDLQYSFELLEPYYVQTGFHGTLTQVVTGSWDVQVHGGQDRLAYRSSVTPDRAGRVDRIERVGGGFGYQVAPELRVGFNVESFYRKSEIPGRSYRAIRAGLIGNYGF